MSQQQTAEDILLAALVNIMFGTTTQPVACVAGHAIRQWEDMKRRTTVVNIRNGEDYDVYIGRPSKWGNPFRLSDYGNDRELLLKVYRHWLLRPAQTTLRRAARRELLGKRLGCFCALQACHGHILIEVIGQCEKEETTDGHCS